MWRPGTSLLGPIGATFVRCSATRSPCRPASASECAWPFGGSYLESPDRRCETFRRRVGERGPRHGSARPGARQHPRNVGRRRGPGTSAGAAGVRLIILAIGDAQKHGCAGDLNGRSGLRSVADRELLKVRVAQRPERIFLTTRHGGLLESRGRQIYRETAIVVICK